MFRRISSSKKEDKEARLMIDNLRCMSYINSSLTCCWSSRYTLISDTHEKSSRWRRKWEYFEAMGTLLAGDHAVRPVRVVSLDELIIQNKPPSGDKLQNPSHLQPPTTLQITLHPHGPYSLQHPHRNRVEVQSHRLTL